LYAEYARNLASTEADLETSYVISALSGSISFRQHDRDLPILIGVAYRHHSSRCVQSSPTSQRWK